STDAPLRMKPIRLIALDLDGTLIPSTLTISPSVSGAIERARAAGVPTTIVTGRMFRAARPFPQAIGVQGPIVCYQGAATYLAESGERLAHIPLSIELGQRIFARA